MKSNKLAGANNSIGTHYLNSCQEQYSTQSTITLELRM